MPASTPAAAPSDGAYATMVFTAKPAREIPSFLTPAPTTRRGEPVAYSPSHKPVYTPSVAPSYTAATKIAAANTTNADRDFRSMLGVALSGATRLAVFAGAMILAAATVAPLRAQAAPPVAPPVTPQVTPSAGQPAATRTIPTAKPATPAAAPQGALQAAPLPPVAPRVPVGSGNAAANKPKLGTKVGNGASVTPGGAAARRPMSQMQIDSAANAVKNPRASAAQTAPVGADEAIMRMLPQVDMKLGDEKDRGLRLNGTVGIVVKIGLLTLLPTLLLMTTGFTRILIVLHFLKQAMGTQSAPPAQLLGALALLLTGFVMAPTLKQVNERAIAPWMEGKINQVEMMKTGVVPMREFMLKQTRESDFKTFIEMSRLPRPNSADDEHGHVHIAAGDDLTAVQVVVVRAG